MKKRLFTVCVAVLLLAAMLLPFAASAQGLVKSTNEPTLNVKYQNLSFRDNVVIKYAVELEGVESAQLLVWTSPESEYVYGTQDKILETVGYQKIDENSDKKYWVYDYTDLSAKEQRIFNVFLKRYGIKYKKIKSWEDLKIEAIRNDCHNELTRNGAQTFYDGKFICYDEIETADNSKSRSIIQLIRRSLVYIT